MSTKSVGILLMMSIIMAALLILTRDDAQDDEPPEASAEAGEKSDLEPDSAQRQETEAATEQEDGDPGGVAREAESDEQGSTQLILGGEDLDYLAIDDIDATVESLKEAFKAGDAHAAYELSDLVRNCVIGPEFLQMADQRLEEAESPEERQQIEEAKANFEAIKGPCEESDLPEPVAVLEKSDQWFWKAAEEGHADAMYEIVFSGRGRLGSTPDGMEVEGEDALLKHRQDYLEKLRDGCHEPSLHSMGLHLARGSDVTAELADYENLHNDPATARAMEAFAHRYAAARIRDEAQAAQEARKPDHLLTAAEERQAQVLAQEILSGC